MKNWFIHFVYLTIILLMGFLMIGENWRRESKVNLELKEHYESLYAKKKAELVEIVIGFHRDAWAKEK